MICTDYLTLGPVPAEEDCAQLGSDGYHARAHAEIRRYRALIREKVGEEPPGARLAIRGFDHDFGRYYELVVEYDPDDHEAVNYALRAERDAPQRWDD